jgi:hypothetical protein
MKAHGFEDIYEVLGGHMFHIETFVSDFQISQGTETLDSFSPLRTAVARLEEALRVSEFQTWKKERPKWSTEYLRQLMKILVQQRYVPYEEACLMMEGGGAEMIRSLMCHDVLFYRHCKDFTFDLPDAPHDPIVCPGSPMERYAMKEILRQDL